jgi:NADH-quinone oxidoreductase subunit H
VLGYLAQVAGVMNFMLKAVVGVIVMMWVRWTLPRLRIDQVMTTCLKYCVPLAAFCFVGAMLWKAANVWSPHDWHSYTLGRSFADTREAWVLTQSGPAVPAGQEPQANVTPPVMSHGDRGTTIILAQETD